MSEMTIILNLYNWPEYLIIKHVHKYHVAPIKEQQNLGVKESNFNSDHE